MISIRPQLRNGLIILLCFISCAAVYNVLFPEQINISSIQYIPATSILENPARFEGLEISSVVYVIAIYPDTMNDTYILDTEEEIVLHYPASLGKINAGDLVYFRGISLIHSMGYIEVFEIHIHDRIGPVLRSLPGIIVFIGLFFFIFTFDFHKLAFVVRRKHSA